MSDLRSKLADAARAVRIERPTGVAGIVDGLHRRSDSAALVTIETVALPPIPVRDESGWQLVGLLTTPGPDGQGRPPWALIRWRLPSGDVAGFTDLRAAPPPVPADSQWDAEGNEADLARLLARIDEVVDGRSGLAALAEHYDAVLPAAAVPWYHALVPATTSWLGTAPTAPPAVDVPAALGGWLRAGCALARELGSAPLVATLDTLAEQRRRPGLRVAVVGEFNRGKSTLVNRLLGTDVLPVGPVPTTRAFVLVRSADRTALAVRWPDGRTELREPGEAMWSGLVVDEHGNGDRSVPELRLDVRAQWLDELDAELVDTPGTNDSLEDRLLDVRRAVTVSDAVLMVVSAGSPLSRSERQLLEQEVLRRRVPFLAVVVTFLEQVPVDERAAALDALRIRVDGLAPGTSVVAAPADDEAGLDGVRAQIAAFAARHTNRHWRSRKIAAGVAEVCDGIVEVAAAAVQAASLTEQERQQELVRARDALARDAAVWDGLRVEIGTRRRALTRRVRDALGADSRVIAEALHYELLRAPDPREYWERDFPYRMRRELVALTRKCETIVLAGMAADVDWLDGVLAERFAVAQRLPRSAPGIAPPELAEQDAVADLGRRKLFTRIGAPAGTLVGYLLGGAVGLAMPPIAIGMAGGLAASILAERSIRSATSAQRDTVDRYLVPVVQQTVDDFAQQVGARVEQLYTDLLDGLESRRGTWRKARAEALAAPAPVPPAANVAREAARLAERIRLALDTDPTPTEER